MIQILKDRDLLHFTFFILIVLGGWAFVGIVQLKKKRRKEKFDKNNEYVDTYQTTERPSYRK